MRAIMPWKNIENADDGASKDKNAVANDVNVQHSIDSIRTPMNAIIRNSSEPIHGCPPMQYHPRKDDASHAAQHIFTEIQEARKLWRESDKTDINSLMGVFKQRLCYNTSVLYVLCSWLKPQIVVETGVWFGASSSFILAALADNKSGHLYSIDLPNVTYEPDARCKLRIKATHSDIIPNGSEPGFGIPLNLRSRWTLIKGDAKYELPKLIAKLGEINLFHHDSLHTYEHMQFEYKTVWPYLSKNGILASDDVDWNDAFKDFCITVGTNYNIYGSTGYAIKGGNSFEKPKL